MVGINSDSTTAGITSSVNLTDYFEVFVKYKSMIFRTTLASFFSAIIFSLLLTKIYTSTALIVPPQQDTGMLGLMLGSTGNGIGSIAGDLLGKGTSSDLYANILKSESIKDKIIDRFKLLEIYNLKYRTDVYQKLDKTVAIEVDKKSGIISISVLDKDPKRAAEIANAYVSELGILSAGLSTNGAFQNKLFLEEQLSKTKSNLIRAEEDLKQFQIKHKTLDISEQTKGTIRGIADLEGQLAMEEVKLASARRIYTDNSQEIKNQQSVVTNIKSEIAKLEGNRINSTIPGIGTMPNIGQEYFRLMRNFKTQEMLMELMTKQYELAKFNESNTNPNIKVIQKAKVADKKTKPKRIILVLFSTVTAFSLTTFFAFLLDATQKMSQEQRNKWKSLLLRLFTIKSSETI